MEQISVTSNELSLVVNNIIKKKFQHASELGFIEKDKLNELFAKLCIVDNCESKTNVALETPPKTKTNTNIIKEQNCIKINEYNKHPKKPSVNLPFCNVIVDKWCFGIKFNHGLYTQCTNKKVKNNVYCKTCFKQCGKNKHKLPNNGDIRNRKYGEIYVAPNKKKEQPYSKIVKKQNIELKFALREAKKLGWSIPKKQLENIKNIKISPVVSDSSDEDESVDIIDVKIKKASKEFPDDSNESKENIEDISDNELDDDLDNESKKLLDSFKKITVKGVEYLLDKDGDTGIYSNNKLVKNLLLDDDGTPIGIYKNKKVYPLEF